MDISKFSFKRLQCDTVIKPFTSSDADLNSFLIDDAKNYYSDLMAVTYLIEEKFSTIAYFSLFNDKVTWSDSSGSVPLWNRLNRRIANEKRRKHYPAVKIGRLAVSSDFEKLGIGSNILELIKFWFIANNRTGCRFITVDAYKAALLFYERNDFQFLTDTDKSDLTHLMYYDLKRLI